jgi:hypothetical protein
MPRIPYDEALARCQEEQLGIRVPVPLNREIDELCRTAEDTGESGVVSKKEMVAAILFEATDSKMRSPKRLVKLLHAYRKAEAGSRMPRSEKSQEHHEYDDLKPGRRKKR